MFKSVLPVTFTKFLRRRLDGFPRLAIPILRLTLGQCADQLVSRDTQLLLEGAGGSGNTFAFMAFKFAQGGDSSVKIAGHTHYSAQVILAVRWRIPVLILIRDPIASIDSLVCRNIFSNKYEQISFARLCLLDYITFYKSIAPHKDKCVISKFENTVNNINYCIENINFKYGCNFSFFDDSEEGMRSCFGDWRTPLASGSRTTRGNAYGSILSENSLQSLIVKAQICYKELELVAI